MFVLFYDFMTVQVSNRTKSIEQSNNRLIRDRLVIPNFNRKIELAADEFVGSFLVDMPMELKMWRYWMAGNMNKLYLMMTNLDEDRF